MTEIVTDNLSQPWGRISGVLVGCLAFLICIARGVGPMEIAGRSVIVAFVTGLLVRMLVKILRSLPKGEPE